MQYRPKLWIGALIALLLIGFEVGFQPLRVIPREKSGTAAMDFDLGQPAGTTPEELAKKADSVRGQLITATSRPANWIAECRFINEQQLRVSTVILTEKDRAADQATITNELKKSYPKVKALPASATAGEGDEPVATIGPLGLYPPKPHVRLGLDLQGGAHVVLQAMSSTEMTFATPEDKPFVTREAFDKAKQEQAKPSEAAKAGETKTAATKAGETKQPAEAAKAGETKPGETKVAEQPKPAETSATAWQPIETPDSLKDNLTKLLTDGGATGVDAQVVAPNLIRVYTRATGESQAKKDHDAVLASLQTEYQGVKIEDRTSSVFVGTDTAEKAKHIIDLRVSSMSEIKEPIVQKQGNDRIIVELPGVKDPKRVTDILKSTAQLEFRLVPKRYTPANAEMDDYSTWKDSQGGQSGASEAAVLAQSPAKFSGRDLKPNAVVEPEPQGTSWEVRFELKDSEKQQFAKFTRDHVGWIMAIVLDGETKMAPVIRSEIPGVGVISGNMTTQAASDLKLLLNAGALPVPLEIVENRQISATLGADAIRQSVEAGIVGFIIVAFFMIGYYRLPGLLADMALTLYIVLMLALLSTWSPLQTTLTLPGIAGIILSIGMAVDANVIIFERIKEELRTRTTARAAVEAGFHRAWPAILDSNVTTVIAAAALYFFGTSSIKSFAVTLLLGVCTHLFTAVTASRWLVNMVARTRLAENRALFGVEPIRPTASSPAGGSE